MSRSMLNKNDVCMYVRRGPCERDTERQRQQEWSLNNAWPNQLEDWFQFCQQSNGSPSNSKSKIVLKGKV